MAAPPALRLVESAARMLVVAEVDEGPGFAVYSVRPVGIVQRRQKHHEVVLFHLFDKAELTFTFDRLTQFIDLETAQRLQVDPKYVRDEYLAQVNAFINGYRRDCSEGHIEYVVTDTSMPYERMLTEYLGRRKRFQ